MSKERIHFAERVKVKLVPRESVANATKRKK